jgi:hypothetical protein
MGREIRRVPADWEHPKGMMRYGYDYLPMHDENFEDALKEYKVNKRLWNKKQHPDQLSGIATGSTFIDWFGEEPDPAYYRPYKDEEGVWFQAYQTVSEGTPVTPVFATLQELEDYLVDVGEMAGTKYNQKYSRSAAHAFCLEGFAVSFVVSSEHGVESGVEALKH